MKEQIEKTINIKRIGYKYLILLTLIFIIGEIVFKIIAESEIEETIIKELVLIIPMVFLYFGHNWAKWTTSILLFLNGILFIVGTFVLGLHILWVFALANILFGIALISSKNIQTIFQKEEIREDLQTIRIDNSTIEIDESFDYPYLLTRLKATFIDGIILLIFLFIFLIIFSNPEYRPIVAIVFFSIAIVYEPVLLTIYSATIGHKLMGIKVISLTRKNQKINILQGIIRILTKCLLGWISFITINFNPGHRAIHDYLSSSIVVKN